jgi:hypothetical protein
VQPAVAVATVVAPVSGVQIPGASGVTVLQLEVSNNSVETVNLTGLVLTAADTVGANSGSGIVAVKVFKNGTLVGAGVYPSSNGVVTINGSYGSLSAGTSQAFVMTDDFSGTAVTGNYGMADTDLLGTGQSSGRNLLISGNPVTGAVITIALPTATPTSTPTFTPTATPTFTPTVTNTFTPSFTPTASATATATPTYTPTVTLTFTPTITLTTTPTLTPTNTPTYTPTVTLTFTPTVTLTFTLTPTVTLTASPTATATATAVPMNRLFLSSGPVTAGTPGPVTILLESAAATPVTATSDLSINLTSNSTGEYSFSPAVTVMAAGTSQVVVSYTDDKAATVNCAANAALPTPSASLIQPLLPGSYSRVQLLFPGQVSDPGRPTADSSGHFGSSGQVVADNTILMTVNAVDKFFNLVNTAATVNLTSSEGTAQSPATLAGGTNSSVPVIFFNAGSPTITGVDSVNAAVTGVSDPINVLPANNSPALNLVHVPPPLSNVVSSQTGVPVFDFTCSIPVGQKPITLTGLTVNAEDQAGNPENFDTALTNLHLIYAGGSLDTAVGAASATLVSGPIPVVSGTSLPITLTADIQSAPTAKTMRLFVSGGSVTEQGAPAGSVTISTVGDSTGFPMPSSLMVFSNGDLAATYGNYPNPFHAGSENTTIEFYLQNPSTVSLDIYDVTGNKVISLLKNVSLPMGDQKEPWDGKNGMGALVLNGVYYAQLNVNGNKLLTKIAVVK